MINFKASYISSSQIQKITQNGYEDFDVSFVELNPFNKDDRKAVAQVAKDWNDNSIHDYSTIISQDMEDELLHLDGECGHTLMSKNKYEPYKYYALTSQKENFELLDFRKILALMDINQKEKHNYIRYFQSHSRHNMLAENPQYRLIGTTMLNCIKKLFPKKDIMLSPSLISVFFYKLNGFVPYGKSAMIFRHK